MEQVILKLNQIIKHHQDILVEHEKDNFYELSLDAYGCPYSFGNADDVYNDGFENGVKNGEFNLAKELLKMLSKGK